MNKHINVITNKIKNNFLTIFLLIISFMIFYNFYLHIKFFNEKKYINDKINKLKENKEIKDEDLINIAKYYINLDKSVERKNKFINQMQEYKLKNYKRISAFDASKIDNMNHGFIDGYEYYNEYEIFNNKKHRIELAITMSHLKAMHQAYKDNCEYAMIMEDDINLCTLPYWKIKLNKTFIKDADIILLANNRYENGEIGIKKCPTSIGYATGVCYVITRKGMIKAGKLINDNKINFLKSHNLHYEQPTVFDRDFLDFFDIYYSSQSLFITEDLNQDSTYKQNLKETDEITKKILNDYVK